MPRTLRTERLHILLTNEEREIFSAQAEAAGESLGAWLRRAGRERALRDEGRRIGLLPQRRVK